MGNTLNTDWLGDETFNRTFLPGVKTFERGNEGEREERGVFLGAFRSSPTGKRLREFSHELLCVF